MRYYLVEPLTIVHSTEGRLTYSHQGSLPLGAIVEVPVGKKTISAIVVGSTAKPKFATKPIARLVAERPLPEHLVLVASWMARYYATHPATVWQTILPRGLGKKRRSASFSSAHPERDRTHFLLNAQQQAAVSTVTSAANRTSLIHGITGSGKTRVYIELAKTMQESGKSSIILVPEIALTSQLIAEFAPHFPNLIVTHSQMTESIRHQTWLACLATTSPCVVIGPRSALFMPLNNLGLIVIDECHEPSFKQEQSPRYSALRTASKIAEFAKAKLVLGSATPSVVDRYLAEKTNSPIIILDKPARPNTLAPNVTIVDMTKRANFTRHAHFSTTLITKMEQAIKNNQQILIFHNRRGTAPTTLCDKCGWSSMCGRCFIPLTLHHDTHQLRCHICGSSERVPTMCPSCHNTSVIHKGLGTKLIHQELTKLFPKAKIMRFDGDNTTDETIDKNYQSLYDGDVDIIIGTQVVAKGLDLPNLRLVGAVQADSGLGIPDYQSAERVFQLINQVTGRVGRNEHASEVVVQTYQPNHPAVRFGITHNYTEFYKYALTERKRAGFPPFSHLLKCVCTYKSEKSAFSAASKLASSLVPTLPKTVEILGPTPAFYERVRDTYRWQIICRSPSRAELTNLVAELPQSSHWRYDLDPASLL